MCAFILRRLLQAAGVLLAVALLAFVLFQYVGDPVMIMLGQEGTPAERDQLRKDLGLSDPVIVQFYHFLTNAIQGDFGLSLRQGQKVSTLLRERLPATLELSIAAALICPWACTPR